MAIPALYFTTPGEYPIHPIPSTYSLRWDISLRLLNSDYGEGCEDDHNDHAHSDDDGGDDDNDVEVDDDNDDGGETQGAATNHQADIAVLTLAKAVHLSKLVSLASPSFHL